MNTNELITILSKNAPAPRRVYLRHMALSLLAALLCAIILIAYTIGLRPDLFELFSNHKQTFKYALTSVFLICSGFAWWRHGQAGRSIIYPLALITLFYILLITMAVISLIEINMDATKIKTLVFDATAFGCVGVTTALAAGISFVLLRLSQTQAPLNTRKHGYLSAFFAISMGIFAYTLHCPFDEPLYMVTWYTISLITFTLIAGPLLAHKQAW
jgi:hypothetical protein